MLGLASQRVPLVEDIDTVLPQSLDWQLNRPMELNAESLYASYT
jgi:hypothetical protein